jgi:hypothetical protein
MSLLALHNYFFGRGNQWLRYEVVVRPARPDGSLSCETEHSYVSESKSGWSGEPLPTNAAARWQELLTRLVRDPGSPILVRNAARCARS